MLVIVAILTTIVSRSSRLEWISFLFDKLSRPGARGLRDLRCASVSAWPVSAAWLFFGRALGESKAGLAGPELQFRGGPLLRKIWLALCVAGVEDDGPLRGQAARRNKLFEYLLVIQHVYGEKKAIETRDTWRACKMDDNMRLMIIVLSKLTMMQEQTQIMYALQTHRVQSQTNVATANLNARKSALT